ncbi:MAG TPA: hypothetical protein PKV67_04735 [Hyphomonas sp.]|nr:hypothetical protein [Hyphomonas sp.]HRJ00059.1 hypothetical protein [Hyphomonas sp.]HRK67954.1 hypothetical protein [Hyphomonas sp.]
MSADEENEETGAPTAMPGVIQLPDALARTVAKAYSELLREPVPSRLAELLEAIRRFEAGQKKSD